MQTLRSNGRDLVDKLCPKCLLRTYVLAPRIRETSPPKGTEHLSPDISSVHIMSAEAFIMEVRKLMHRGDVSSAVSCTGALRLRYRVGAAGEGKSSPGTRARGQLADTHGHIRLWRVARLPLHEVNSCHNYDTIMGANCDTIRGLITMQLWG